METASEAPAGIGFGRYLLLPHRRELLADGRPIKLGGRALDVLIALIEDGRPMLGVVHGPAIGVTYTAHGPGTAMRRRGSGEFAPIRARVPPPEGVVVIHSRSHENSRRLAEYFEGKPVLERHVCGSALKFGVLAAGEADCYPRFGTTMEWDTCAGQAVLEAAGGHVFGLDGAPLRYGKTGLKNDGFLAWGAKPAW